MYHTWLWQLDLFNEKGELQKKYKIKDYPLESGCSFRRPDILPYSDTPIKKVDNYIILQGQGCNVCDSQSNQIPEGVTLLLNLKDSLVRHENGYPEIYNQKGIWQTFAYRVVPYDLSPQGEMVINYTADDSIRVFNIHTKKTQCYFAGYSKPYTIHPARSEKEVDRSIMEQVQYTSIYYDKWNQLYYRLLTLPLSDYDVNEKSAPKRNLAVIILDKYFQKVGEYNIKEPSNRFSRAFVSSEGLHINILSDNDDYLTFITVKPKKL